MNIQTGYKTTKLGPLPGEWSVVTLGDILLKKPGYGAAAPAKTFDPQNTYRYIRITDFDDNGKLLNNHMAGIDKHHGKDFLLKQNDLLIARSGHTTGKSFLYDSSYGQCAFAGAG